MLNRQRHFRIARVTVEVICAGVLAALGRPPCTLDVVFVGMRKMRSLNRRFRGRDYATDVLSFAGDGSAADGRPWLGEIVIAPDVALVNALRWRTSPDAEIRRLLVHGVLHLLGYDHERDRGEMDRLQGRLARRSFFVRPSPVAVLRERRPC